MSRRTLSYVADCLVLIFAISFVVTVIGHMLDLHGAITSIASGVITATVLYGTHS